MRELRAAKRRNIFPWQRRIWLSCGRRHNRRVSKLQRSNGSSWIRLVGIFAIIDSSLQACTQLFVASLKLSGSTRQQTERGGSIRNEKICVIVWTRMKPQTRQLLILSSDLKSSPWPVNEAKTAQTSDAGSIVRSDRVQILYPEDEISYPLQPNLETRTNENRLISREENGATLSQNANYFSINIQTFLVFSFWGFLFTKRQGAENVEQSKDQVLLDFMEIWYPAASLSIFWLEQQNRF